MKRGGGCHLLFGGPLAGAALLLLLAARVAVPVGIEVPRLVTLVRMVGAGLFHGARRRGARVAMAVRIEIARDVPLMGMMGSGLFGWLICHGFLLAVCQP